MKPRGILLLASAVFVLCLIWPLAAAAQFGTASRPKILVTAAPKTPTALPGKRVEVPVLIEIPHELHINTDKPTFDYLIPTKVTWESKEWKLAGMEYPPALKKSFSFSPDGPLDVWEGTVTVKSLFTVPKNAKPGKAMLAGKLRYQACDDKACYPPTTVPFEVPVEVKK